MPQLTFAVTMRHARRWSAVMPNIMVTIAIVIVVGERRSGLGDDSKRDSGERKIAFHG